jgi:hypothetical protein
MTFYYWNQSQLWGGGLLPGIYPHPTISNRVAVRCDVGGLYIYNSTNKSWNLVGDFTEENDYGGAGFAWHPTEPNTFFMLCGRYVRDNLAKPGSLYKSTDNGVTVTKMPFPSIPIGANENRRRFSNNRIVICPTNPDIILVATYSGSQDNNKGIYRSADGGQTWTQIPFSVLAPGRTIPAINSLNGQTSLAFDDRGGNFAGICYCAIFGLGLVKSEDFGQTWAFIGGAIYGMKLLVKNGILYCAALNNASLEIPTTTGMSGLSRYSGAGESWDSLLSGDMSWVAINTSGHIYCGYPYNSFWRISTNGGTSFTIYNIGNNYVNTVPYQDAAIHPVGFGVYDLGFDADNVKAWFSDQYYVWENPDTSNTDMTWINRARNLETTVPYDFAWTEKHLFGAWWDINAHKYDRGLERPPTRKAHATLSTKYESALGIDFCRNSPDTVVACLSTYTAVADVCVTNDSGETWAIRTGVTLPSKVAVSNNNPLLWVVCGRSGSPQFTVNGGVSYVSIGAIERPIPFGQFYAGRPVVADSADPNVFWLFHDDISSSANYGRIYKLTHNNGSIAVSQPFTTRLRTFDGGKNPRLYHNRSRLWIAADELGLYYSEIEGTLVQVPGVTFCSLMAFGKSPTTNALHDATYIYGTIGGVTSVWESLDGETWAQRLDIISNSPFHQRAKGILGAKPTALGASPIDYAKVVLGTDGHGFFYSSQEPVNSAFSGGGVVPPPGGVPGETLLILSFNP